MNLKKQIARFAFRVSCFFFLVAFFTPFSSLRDKFYVALFSAEQNIYYKNVCRKQFGGARIAF